MNRQRTVKPAVPIELERVPATNEERKLLREACRAMARAKGKRGQPLKIETERIYQASIEQAARTVKAIHRPTIVLPPDHGVLVVPRMPKGLVGQGA